MGAGHHALHDATTASAAQIEPHLQSAFRARARAPACTTPMRFWAVVPSDMVAAIGGAHGLIATGCLCETSQNSRAGTAMTEEASLPCCPAPAPAILPTYVYADRVCAQFLRRPRSG